MAAPAPVRRGGGGYPLGEAKGSGSYPLGEAILQHHAGQFLIDMAHQQYAKVSLVNGEKVKILEDQGSHVKVQTMMFKYKGEFLQGWVDSRDVRKPEQVATTSAPAFASRTGITKQEDGFPQVYLRGPRPGGNIIGCVSNGLEVQILEEMADSVKVRWSKLEGWAKRGNIVSRVMDCMSQSRVPTVSEDERRQILTLQHELLDWARNYDWDDVKKRLEEHPEFLNVQPLKRDGTRRWSVLHQAAEAGDEQVVEYLLELGADVTLTNNEDQTALDVAKPEVRKLLEEHKPKPACPSGAACFNCEIEHRKKYSHAAGTLANIQKSARKLRDDFYGPGQWELNVRGDVKDDKSWVPLHETFMGDAAFFCVEISKSAPPRCNLWICELEIPKKRKLAVTTVTQEAEVDFQTFSCNLYGVDGHDKKLSLPLRRMSSNVSIPRGPAEEHPFYQMKAARAESPGTWMTQSFFFLAFEEALKRAGIPAPEKLRTMFNEAYNEDWLDKRPCDCELERRGGVLYRAPAGWKRFGLDVEKYGEDKTWLGMRGEEGSWATAYHGTSMDVLPLIVNDGFRVGPADGAKDCPDNRTGQKCGKGIFCTPNLTTVECYSNGCEDGSSIQKKPATTWQTVDGKQHTLFFAVMCKVNPDAIRRPERHFSINNDEEIMGIDGVFEWVINDPKDIRPYGILVRDKEGSDHRHLGDLIAPCYPTVPWGHNRWNVEHKPLPFGSFDYIEGRTVGHDLLQASYMQACANIRRQAGELKAEVEERQTTSI